MSGSSGIQGATSDTDPEIAAYIQSRAHLSEEPAQPLGRQDTPMPGPGMSAEHQMPSREMNEPSSAGTPVRGEMPRPNMT